MSEQEPAAEGPETDDSVPELPYAITPHIAITPQPEGRMRFRFGRSFHPALAMSMRVGALGAALLTLLLWLVGARQGLIFIMGAISVVTILLVISALWRSTTGRAEPGGLHVRTEYLPLLGYERTLRADEIRSLRRHMSLRMGGQSVYQIRAHLAGEETFAVGHGITDKVEAASIAAAMERVLRPDR